MRGNIYANIVIISGTVKGNVFSRDRIFLYHSARLEGDIESAEFITQNGTQFKGICKILPKEEKNPSSSSKLIPKNKKSKTNLINNNSNSNLKNNNNLTIEKNVD